MCSQLFIAVINVLQHFCKFVTEMKPSSLYKVNKFSKKIKVIDYYTRVFLKFISIKDYFATLNYWYEIVIIKPNAVFYVWKCSPYKIINYLAHCKSFCMSAPAVTDCSCHWNLKNWLNLF